MLSLPLPSPPDPLSQYSTFLSPSFDPNTFAHSILSPASTEETDVSSALAKLNFGVEDLTRQLKNEIGKHHSSLLLAAASLGGLEGDLEEVRRGIGEVEGGVVRLKRKITTPHTSLSSSLTLLTRLRRASSLAKRAARFTVLARRLESQMGEIEGWPGGRDERRERAMGEAALTLAELDLLLSPPPPTTLEEQDDDPEFLLPIQSLTAISALVPAVEHSRERVVEEMEGMVQRGLSELDNPLLASSLQTAHNLKVLPSLVESLIGDLTETVGRKVRGCFDMNSLGREVAAKDPQQKSATPSFVYKSRSRNEPTTVTLPIWTQLIWSRFEGLVGELGGVCLKVYSLEKILKLKTGTDGNMSFLDEAMTVLDNKPSLLFWTTLSTALETAAKDSVKTSTFIQQTLSTGYPRFLRLFQEFFSKISGSTDTVYTLSQQSPETVLVLRSISPFETLYLTRSTNRLTEIVHSSFSISSSISSFTSRPPSVPTANEGLATARAIVNELDAARFDPLLVKAIAKASGKAVENFVGRAQGLVQQDYSATSMLGPLATPAQHSNADLAGSLYHLWLPLHRALPEHSESVRSILKPSVEGIRTAYLAISNPLIMAIRREFSLIITRMHRTDYSKKEGGSMMSLVSGGGGGASSYMSDLTDKLSFVREELLGNYRVGDLAKEWALDLARFTVQTFVLHASIVRCPSEAGKLKLTADTTALEFAISQYLSSHSLALSSMGDQFKALRAFRPLLFLDNSQLSNNASTTDVPTLILLHHVLSRSSLALPHQTQGWTEAEYVRWLNEHGEKDRIGIIERTVRKREENGVDEKERVYVDIVRAILSRRSG